MQSLSLRGYDLVIKSNGVLFEKWMTRVGGVPKTNGLVGLSYMRVECIQKRLALEAQVWLWHGGEEVKC